MASRSERSPALSTKLRKQLVAAALVKEIPVTGWVYTATASPDGRTLLLGGNGAIDVVDLNRGSSRQVTPPAARREEVSRLAFTPDGKRVVATLWSGAVAVLAWPTLKQIAVHQVTDERLHALAVMPDGRSAWVGGGDEKRTRIDLRSGRVLASQQGERMWLGALALSPDGKTLVTGDAATNVRICDGKTGKQKKVTRLGSAHELVVTADEVLVPSLEFASVNLATGRVRKRFEGVHRLGARAAVVLDGGAFVASVGNHEATFAIWERASGLPRLMLKPLKKRGFETLVTAGENLVTVPYCDGPLQIWRTQALVDAARHIHA
ncbi:MAG TPA: WD40 repeat domain-containing protein [Kofleriaceae bacterium]|nr:WD40 repeat domain-containing protein [Kofleriaceae bacterium]